MVDNQFLANYLAGLDKMKTRLEQLESENKDLADRLEAADKNRASLIREKRELEGRAPAPQRAASGGGDMVISRDDARDGARYRAAKEAAQRAGKRLVIVDDNAAAQRSTGSPVKHLHDEMGGIYYANRELVATVGLGRLQQIAAEKNARLNVFRSTDDLPQPMRQRHAEVIASGDRDALLNGGSR